MEKLQLKYNFVAFVAPQGGGKDTQMDIIKGKMHDQQSAVLSMSDILRHYQKTDESFAQMTSLMMSRGILVGDDIVVERLMMYINDQCSTAGQIILNGFPRTLAQAMGLWAVAMKTRGAGARVAVVKFDLEHKVAYSRCIDRLNKMKARGEKPRDDDNPELIEDRLNTYFLHLPEIISGARLFADVYEIDACKSVEEVTDQILKGIAVPVGQPPIS